MIKRNVEITNQDNILKQRIDKLCPKDKKLVFAEIMHDFKVSRNTVYRWLRLANKDLPIVLLNYGVPNGPAKMHHK
jgi:plasmid replication initiation protein